MATKKAETVSERDLRKMGKLKRKKIMISIPEEIMDLFDKYVVEGQRYNDRSVAIIEIMTDEIMKGIQTSQK